MPSTATPGYRTAARLKERLQDFRNTHASAQAGVSAVAALPGDTLAAALMLKTLGTVSVDGKVSDADLNYLGKHCRQWQPRG
ncbi:conjugal transfer protein TraF [Escherichia coli]